MQRNFHHLRARKITFQFHDVHIVWTVHVVKRTDMFKKPTINKETPTPFGPTSGLFQGA